METQILGVVNCLPVVFQVTKKVDIYLENFLSKAIDETNHYEIDLESKEVFLYQMQHAIFQFLMAFGIVQPISMSPLTQVCSSKLPFGNDPWTMQCDIICCM